MPSIYENQVYTLFIAYFGRPPSPTGLAYYTGVMEQSNGNWKILVDDFYKSAESQQLFGNKTIEQQVNQVFKNIFGRDAAPAGLNYWTLQVMNGVISVAEMAYTIAYNCAANDALVRDAKIATGKLWTSSLDQTNEILAYGTDAGRQSARDFLSTVTTATPKTQAEVDAAIEQMVQGGSGGNPGQTFTLTNGIDVFKGTSGNDVFSGAVTAQGAVTFQAFDLLDGGAGKDILIAQNIGTLSTNASTIKNIERIEVYGMVASATLGLGNTSGVEEILIANSVGDATVTGINAGIKVLEVAGNPTAAVLDGFTFTVQNAAVSGSDDKVTLKLAGVGDSTTNDKVTIQPTSGVNGYETITVSAQTSPSFVMLDDGGSTSLKTLNIEGDANLTMTVTPATLTKLDATNATGNLTLDLTTNNQDLEVIGGKGDDSFNFGNNLTKGDKINGGEGKNTLQFNSAATTLTDTFQVQNIQTLRINDALAANLDVSKFGTSVNSVRLNADTGAHVRTISKLGANATLDLRVAQTVGTQHTLQLASTSGTDDKVTVALNGNYSAGGATMIDYQTVQADNVEYITVQSNYGTNGNPDNAGDQAALTLNVAQAKELTITGKVGITLAGSTITSVTKIDSTGLVPEVAPATTLANAGNGDGGIIVTLATGANQTAVVTTGNGNNNITSGAGSDNITTGSGADLVTIGTGNDTVNLGAGDDVLVLTGNGQLTSDDTIVGGDGTDVLRLTAAATTLADGAFTNVSGFERIDGTGAFNFAVNLGANAAAAFGNKIRIDQAATANQVWNINGAGLTSGQTIEFRGASATAATNDTIVGGGGNDKIAGGLNGAAGGDSLTGGSGADIFFFRSDDEASGGAAATDTASVNMDRITDYVAGVDKIQVQAVDGLNFNTDATATVTYVNANANNYNDLGHILAVVGGAVSNASAAQVYVITVAAGQINATGFSGKTLLVVNNGTAALSATDDLIIDITGVTGVLSGADFAFGNLFA